MKEEMKVVVEIRTVYGQELIDPVCVKSKSICVAMGTKTLTQTAINILKILDYKIEVQQKQRSL